MTPQTLPLNLLVPHPLNSNAMPPALFKKLVGHLRASCRYPPIIVRPMDDRYQILDGHHRCQALLALGHTEARCDIWPVDEAEALVLLATLNRLEGHDDPRKRAALLGDLAGRVNLHTLASRLPEDTARLKRYLALADAPPPTAPPRALKDMPVAMYFFLLPDQKRRVEAALDALDPSREAALLKLIDTI